MVCFIISASAKNAWNVGRPGCLFCWGGDELFSFKALLLTDEDCLGESSMGFICGGGTEQRP